MELNKVHQRLKQIQTELIGLNTCSKETLIRVEKLSKEIKPIAVEIFGEEDEITGELESAILISEDYDQENYYFRSEPTTEALRHLQYGIALFLDQI